MNEVLKQQVEFLEPLLSNVQEAQFRAHIAMLEDSIRATPAMSSSMYEMALLKTGAKVMAVLTNDQITLVIRSYAQGRSDVPKGWLWDIG